MTQNVAHLITASGILLFVDGEQFTVANDHPNIGKIRDAIGRKDYQAIPALADIRTAVRKWMSSGKDFALVNDQIVLNDAPFSAEVTDKVLNMIDAGNDADPIFNFLRKVRLNPSKAAQDELLLFCVANGFMIHADGDILAYKSVRGNYTDIHSGKFRNAVGDVVTMERFQVDDDRNRTCSAGLHFASHEYASTWAGPCDGVNRRLMLMKINPRDVVAIPNDYENQKGRCARYEVIAELPSGNRLPKREVYFDSDIDLCTCPDGERCCKDEDSDEDRRAEIDALQDRISDLESEIEDFNDRINIVENNGGDATDLRSDRDIRLDALDALYDELNDLTD